MKLELNEEQQKPAKHLEGAILVSAGAGSGKTRLLTARVMNLLDTDIQPYHILCITFTNKAAAEMRERLSGLTDTGDMWIMTFHAMCTRLLREAGDIGEGWNRSFTIYSEQEKDRVIKDLLKTRNLDADEYAKPFKHYLSDAKQEVSESPNDCLETRNFGDEKEEVLSELFFAYEEVLRKNNAMDFDDLLLNCYRMLKKYPDQLARVRRRFWYICVDEFQDTNRLQYEIVRLIGQKRTDADGNTAGGNVFIVGDEDQSIYGWRGANIKNMADFITDFDATVYKLEQNYRSTGIILSAANAVIAHNRERIKKKLWTDRGDGARIERYTARSETEEAEYIARSVLVLNKLGIKNNEIAVLMRLNAISRAFEERMTAYGIPYEVFGGFRFFERKEVKDLVAYLRILANPSDDEAVLRVINTPKRGIGDGAVSQLKNYCALYKMPLSEACANIYSNQEVPRGLIAKIAPFGAILNDLFELGKTEGLSGLIRAVIRRTDFLSQFEPRNLEENQSRLGNIDQLISSADEFVKMNPDEPTLQKYLEGVTLYSDIDALDGEKNSVTLATVHAAKGLEFKAVFVVGLDERIFPILRDDGDIEEERRLMYVAMTRAKERLFLTRADSRFLYGKREPMTASRFLSEDGHIPDVPKVPQRYGTAVPSQKSPPAALNGGIFSQSRAAVDYEAYRVGVRVRHPSFGDGTITKISNLPTCIIAEVKFQKVGVKSLAVGLTRLDIIG